MKNKMMYIILFAVALVILGGYFYSNMQRPPESLKEGSVMTSDVALTLVRAWAKHINSSLDELKISRDGSFRGAVGSAGFEYRPSEAVLVARGFVYHDGIGIMAVPSIEQDLASAASREASTMAGGFFDLDREARIWNDGSVSLTLRRDFREALEPSQFVEEVQDLVDASTYWRKVRLTEVLKYDEADLVRQWEERSASSRKN